MAPARYGSPKHFCGQRARDPHVHHRASAENRSSWHRPDHRQQELARLDTLDLDRCRKTVSPPETGGLLAEPEVPRRSPVPNIRPCQSVRGLTRRNGENPFTHWIFGRPGESVVLRSPTTGTPMGCALRRSPRDLAGGATLATMLCPGPPPSMDVMRAKRMRRAEWLSGVHERQQ